MIKTTLPLLFALFVLLLPLNARADNVASTANNEFGLLTGYGISHIGFGATLHQVQTWDTILRAGFCWNSPTTWL